MEDKVPNYDARIKLNSLIDLRLTALLSLDEAHLEGRLPLWLTVMVMDLAALEMTGWCLHLCCTRHKRPPGTSSPPLSAQAPPPTAQAPPPSQPLKPGFHCTTPAARAREKLQGWYYWIVKIRPQERSFWNVEPWCIYTQWFWATLKHVSYCHWERHINHIPWTWMNKNLNPIIHFEGYLFVNMF